MRSTGEPDFTFYAFDLVTDDLTKPYLERMKDLQEWFDENPSDRVTLVLPKTIENEAELLAFEAECLAEGFEGVMVRAGDGKYKEGRATTKEGLLMKVKRFDDAEAEVIGYEELQHNNNVAEKDNFGRTKRSHHQENKVGAGVLGKLICKDVESGITFGVGTGFDAAQRAEYWADRDNLVGRFVTYKSFNIGVKEAPRHPVFLHFRDPDDMG
jgi:DNA ligase-1